MGSEWWTTFFEGHWLEVQRTMRSSRTDLEVSFLESKLSVKPGGRILDVPCGNGRLAIPLSQRGYHVTGVDITSELLDEGRSDVASTDVEFVNCDMRELTWANAFDAAYCFWGSFGYFDDTGNRRFIEAVSDALIPGGRFVLDIPNVAETILPRLQSRVWNRLGEMLVLENHVYHPDSSRLDIEWTLIKDGSSEAKTTSMRVYGYRELVELFAGCGFGLSEALSGLDGGDYTLGRRGYFIFSKAN